MEWPICNVWAMLFTQQAFHSQVFAIFQKKGKKKGKKWQNISKKGRLLYAIIAGNKLEKASVAIEEVAYKRRLNLLYTLLFKHKRTHWKV